MLRSVTETAAAALGYRGHIGVLKARATADFIIVGQDPTENLEILPSPVQLSREGRSNAVLWAQPFELVMPLCTIRYRFKKLSWVKINDFDGEKFVGFRAKS